MYRTEKFTIRAVSSADLHRIYEIEIKSFKSPFSYKMLEKLASVPNIIYLVGEFEHKIIGYIISSVHLKEAHLISIAIEDKYRRQGFGTALLQNIIKNLKEQKIKKLRLEVRVGNEPAKSFYSHFNFKIIKIKRKYYSDVEDALEMELRL